MSVASWFLVIVLWAIPIAVIAAAIAGCTGAWVLGGIGLGLVLFGWLAQSPRYYTYEPPANLELVEKSEGEKTAAAWFGLILWVIAYGLFVFAIYGCVVFG